MTATDAAAGRTAIGAGTSSLVVGTTAGTAAEGNDSRITGAVAKSTYDAHSILAATTDDTPAALTVGASTIVGRGATGNIAALTAAAARNLLTSAGPVHTDVDIGEANAPRLIANSAVSALNSGAVYVVYFTAQKTEAVASIRISTGATAAAATPSLVKFGFYSVASPYGVAADLTLLGVTANDTSIFASVNTSYTRALVTPTTKTAGQRYAIGVLVVSAAATPTLLGLSLNSAEAGNDMVLCATIAGQTDITGDITSTLTVGPRLFLGTVLPT
jgi:hypothetical protein